MNLWLRLITYLFRLRSRPRIGILDSSNMDFRVLPADLDLNLHVNNGRYLALMDLGRLDLITCTGLASNFWRKGWRPIVGSAFISFRKELGPFERFRLETQILGWEGRWFYIQQRFWKKDTMAAEAVVKALIVDKNGALQAKDVVAEAGYQSPSPALSAELLARFAPLSTSSG